MSGEKWKLVKARVTPYFDKVFATRQNLADCCVNWAAVDGTFGGIRGVYGRTEPQSCRAGAHSDVITGFDPFLLFVLNCPQR